MIIGIFRSLNSFCAIFKGSVSPAISTVTGAFILFMELGGGKQIMEVR